MRFDDTDQAAGKVGVGIGCQGGHGEFLNQYERSSAPAMRSLTSPASAGSQDSRYR